MKKINVLIADDEADALDLLTEQLNEHERINILGKVNDSKRLENAVNMLNPDVLFLDLKMPGLSGVDYLKKLRHYNMNLTVVIVTAHSDLLSEVINYQVFSSLLKPVNRNELTRVIEQIMEHLRIEDNEKIKLPIQSGFLFLDHSEILLLEAEGNYTRIVTTTNEKYLSSYNMGRLFKKLNPDTFFRINRHCILNSDYLKRIDKKKNMGVVSCNGSSKELELSNSFITFFNKHFS